ncbi:gluconate 2-dehydrogenase subunit 3 family protein [Pedobacter sp. SYP-B3415]|uniref:gluconate 2-dehydrogenase subunit 3 family protein n=1 Tax=Pedobacter sp. SYP-B3415 TaxID=2496641 RepID=UPI00101D932D|nr:gluconate 2-dehydrogenase subunit 3 family protein [Pedobacter sp. SYP-B3415]
MKRRTAIQQILILAGGVVLLPSCLQSSGKASIALSHLDMTLDQEQLLAEVTETILPKTDTPGAKDLKLHLYVMKMVDDCHPEEERKSFLQGLKNLDAYCTDAYGMNFSGLTPIDRERALLAISNKTQELPEGLNEFYQIVKNRSIDGYLNSEYVMKNLVVWELVPGRYNGYFPVKTAKING